MNPVDGAALLRMARAAIAERLGVADAVPPEPDEAFADELDAAADFPEEAASLPATLAAPGATFVTLTRDGRLRGCIGSLEAWRPLAEDVRANAVAAAFRDPRFPKLRADELVGVRIEVSVLGPTHPMAFQDEPDLLRQLNPHVDGVVLVAGGHRATFLPQVWEQLPDPLTFLRHLKRKAGLPEQYWGPDVEVSRYRVTSYHE